MAVNIVITSMFLFLPSGFIFSSYLAAPRTYYPSDKPVETSDPEELFDFGQLVEIVSGHLDLLQSENRLTGGIHSFPALLYNMTRAPRTAMPSEPTEPIVAAPAVLEALALAPVAVPVPVPVPEDSVVVAVELAVDERTVVVVEPVPVPVLVIEPVVDGVVSGVELGALDGEVLPVLPALADEQLSPALMAEQKALAAGRTSSALVVNIWAYLT